MVRLGRTRSLILLSQCRLVFFEAEAPQPEHNVHDGAHNQWWRA